MSFHAYWAKVKLLLRIKYGQNGSAVGFHAGGPSHRGMSIKNIRQFYRKALKLGGMSDKDAMKYSFHGAKRAHVTFAKNFGDAKDGDVALGTKHAHAGTLSHYNDASRAQLSKPGLFQGELRDQIKAVMAFKAQSSKNSSIMSNPSTPPRVPGEVKRSKDAVSPTEVHRLKNFLDAKGLDLTIYVKWIQ